MKKLKPRRYVIIGDTTFYHGDYITACIDRQDEDNEDRSDVQIENGRICINQKSDSQEGERHFNFWICQDERDGCKDAETRFEFKYSWVAKVNKDGDIISNDTEWVLLEKRCDPEDIKITEEQPTPSIEESDDDDPMPIDWMPSEKDLLFLKG